MPRKKSASMSDAHKAALAAGREHSRAVRRYLEALETSKPRRGRKPSKEKLQARLAEIEEQIATAGSIERLSLVQQRIDAQERLAGLDETEDISELEAGFVEHAKPYAESKGITYAAFREVGVPAAVLQQAGIPRR